MTLERTARRLAAPALTIAALWLCGVCASADVDAGGGPVIREPFPAAVALANRPLDNDDDVINQTFGADAALANRLFGGGGSEQEAREGSYRGKTVILHSNDTIGAAEGFPRMAWLRREFERLGAETILVDAGNFSIGSMRTGRFQVTTRRRWGATSSLTATTKCGGICAGRTSPSSAPTPWKTAKQSARRTTATRLKAA